MIDLLFSTFSIFSMNRKKLFVSNNITINYLLMLLSHSILSACFCFKISLVHYDRSSFSTFSVFSMNRKKLFVSNNKNNENSISEIF